MGTGREIFTRTRNAKGLAETARPFDVGGAERDRTADLYNAIVALSQLSYGPIGCFFFAGGRASRLRLGS